MKAVNLLPPERRGIRPASRYAPFVREPLLIAASGLAVLVVGGLGYSAHSASSQVASKNEAIRQVDGQLAKLAPVQPAASGTSRLTALTTLADGRTTWDGFLGTLSRVVPEDVWLLSLTAQAPAQAASAVPSTTSDTSAAPAAPAAAPTVTFTGYTYSQPSVARMMRRLELVPWLQNVSLTTSTKTAINAHTVYQFTLGASFVSLPEVGT
jgi:Tfp pilus assembly protein PilN